MPMNKKQLAISMIMTVFIIAFMIISPKYIAMSRNPLTQHRDNTVAEGYQGIITVWHIVGFKPYQGSLGTWLGKAALQLEKDHCGVYFEVDSIDMAEFEARIARGEQPDIFSFPLGCLYAEQLCELDLDLPELRGNVADVGCYDGRLYAVPYTASGYLLIHNQRLMQERGADSESMAEMLKNGAVSAAGDAVQACIFGVAGEMLSQEDFIEERAVSAFVDARTSGDLDRKVQQGKGFPYEVLPCKNYTDLVQLMGANANIQPEKLPYVYELLGLCLETDEQQGLADLGLMPLLTEAQIEKSDDEAINLLFDELKDIAAPNSFLYKTYREQLRISAAEAMGGSEGAKKDLELRLRELVRGAVIK